MIRPQHHLYQFILTIQFRTNTVILLVLILVSCNNYSHTNDKEYKPVYSSGSLPTKMITIGMPAQFMNDAFVSFSKYFNQKDNGFEIRVVMCQSFEDFDNKLRHNFFDVAFVNAYQALEIMDHGYSVIAKMVGDDLYKGIILVRKDANINSIAELKNKTLSFPGPSALTGTMLPLYFLYQNGLNVNKDVRLLSVASAESSIMSVFLGKSDAAASWLIPWYHFEKNNPEMASQLLVKWKTPALMSPPVMARTNMDTVILRKLKTMLFTLQNDAAGKTFLKSVSSINFQTATNEMYQPIKEFIRKYNTVIHL